MNWDIFFISYQETNAELNWKRLLSLHPNAKRLHGITGIHKPHILANELSNTDYFWVIDGDNYVIKELDFDTPEVDLTLFHAIDPLQETPTTLGSAKLWKRNSFINKDLSKGDFTLFSTQSKTLHSEIYTMNNYNVTAYETWKTAFRHCVKLNSIILKSIRHEDNINFYLDKWKSTEYSKKMHADWAFKGYCDAKIYADKCADDLNKLNLINDFDWLRQYFESLYQNLILSEPNL